MSSRLRGHETPRVKKIKINKIEGREGRDVVKRVNEVFGFIGGDMKSEFFEFFFSGNRHLKSQD